MNSYECGLGEWVAEVSFALHDLKKQNNELTNYGLDNETVYDGEEIFLSEVHVLPERMQGDELLTAHQVDNARRIQVRAKVYAKTASQVLLDQW